MEILSIKNSHGIPSARKHSRRDNDAHVDERTRLEWRSRDLHPRVPVGHEWSNKRTWPEDLNGWMTELLLKMPRHFSAMQATSRPPSRRCCSRNRGERNVFEPLIFNRFKIKKSSVVQNFIH